MPLRSSPTPYPEVNATLEHLLLDLRAALGSYLGGVYLVGSLALGGFDEQSSDLDLLVVTEGELSDDVVDQLADFHQAFAASKSPWASRLEAIYVPREVLNLPGATAIRLPQVEVGQGLIVDVLEGGWVFQRHNLRERGVVLLGAKPNAFVAPSTRQEMAAAVGTITAEWLEQAEHDPSWLAWLRERDNHTFVLRTLCRMLYSLTTGSVTSKPGAVRWAKSTLDRRWVHLLDRTLSSLVSTEPLAQEETDDTLAFIAFTLAQAQYLTLEGLE